MKKEMRVVRLKFINMKLEALKLPILSMKVLENSEGNGIDDIYSFLQGFEEAIDLVHFPMAREEGMEGLDMEEIMETPTVPTNREGLGYRGYFIHEVNGFYEVETHGGEWLFHQPVNTGCYPIGDRWFTPVGETCHPNYYPCYTTGLREVQRRIDYREYRITHSSRIDPRSTWRFHIIDGVLGVINYRENNETYVECMGEMITALLFWAHSPEGWGE